MVLWPLALVICPKLPGAFTVVPGWFQYGVLVALNASARNCTLARSRMRKFLNREASMLCCDGARRSGDVRLVFPRVNSPACEKTVVSKYAFKRLSTGPVSFADLPLLLGRCVLVPRLVLLAPLPIISGTPVWYV